jgi:tetratricopeptide (TPR) repeat protein
MHKKLITLLLLTVTSLSILKAQISSPPNGDNQKSEVTQYMGFVKVTITWNSPDVHGANGEDRTGKIWGELVPYGLSNLDFGLSDETHLMPWRAGANENTVFSVSHDVQIEGKNLPAGKYGLHMIPGKENWVIIFSKNYTSWGSYFYQESEDALRVTVKSQPHAYTEWLGYEFDDRMPASCTVRMNWEKLAVPFKISVPNINELYLAKIKEELRTEPGFDYQNFVSASQFCAQRKFALEQGLAWAEDAISKKYVGVKNFPTLSNKAKILTLMGREAEATALMKEAIKDPSAGMQDIHMFARSLQASKKLQEALEVFKLNNQRFPDAFMTLFGLARGYSGVGDYKNALKYANLALPKATDAQQKSQIEAAVKKLSEGKDFN